MADYTTPPEGWQGFPELTLAQQRQLQQELVNDTAAQARAKAEGRVAAQDAATQQQYEQAHNSVNNTKEQIDKRNQEMQTAAQTREQADEADGKFIYDLLIENNIAFITVPWLEDMLSTFDTDASKKFMQELFTHVDGAGRYAKATKNEDIKRSVDAINELRNKYQIDRYNDGKWTINSARKAAKDYYDNVGVGKDRVNPGVYNKYSTMTNRGGSPENLARLMYYEGKTADDFEKYANALDPNIRYNWGGKRGWTAQDLYPVLIQEANKHQALYDKYNEGIVEDLFRNHIEQFKQYARAYIAMNPYWENSDTIAKVKATIGD